MACDVQTVADLIAADKLPALSERDRLICLAYVYSVNAGVANAQAAVLLARQAGMSKLSDADLEKAFAAAIC